jgi:hypothetical protein
MQTYRPGGWQLWASWAFAHALVVAVCLVLPCRLFALAAGGTIAQWLILRRRLPGAVDWPLYTAGGIVAGVPFLAGALFNPANRSDELNVLLFALFTATIGLAQWFALRTHVNGAGWWVAASAAGGALFWPAYEAVWSWANALYTDLPIRWLLAWHAYATSVGYGEPSVASILTWLCQGAAGDLAYGAVTDLGLPWLLHGTETLAARPRVTAAVRE